MYEELVEKALNADKKIKGYAFDSLVFRYKMAREKQAEFEISEAKRSGNINKMDKAKSMAERDIMRFIQILDDVIGEHD